MIVTFTIKSKSCKSGYRVQALEINSFQFWLLCVFQVICMFWLIFFQRVTGLVDLHIFLNLDPKNWVNEKKSFYVYKLFSNYKFTSNQRKAFFIDSFSRLISLSNKLHYLFGHSTADHCTTRQQFSLGLPCLCVIVSSLI